MKLPASRGYILLAVLLLIVCKADKDLDDSVAGPTVKLKKDGHTQQLDGNARDLSPPPHEAPEPPKTLTDKLEDALKKEFKAEGEVKDKNINQLLNETQSQTEQAQAQEAVIESVVRITSKDGTGGSNGNSSGTGQDSIGHASAVDMPVDRAVAADGAEFVLSKPGDGGTASLTMDPQLIMDLTTLLCASGVFGLGAEALHMPTMNGYLVAGAVVGPGGLNLIKELVQVQTLAQLGVSLLLFGLGMELSPGRLRATWGVAVVGGTLQVVLAMGLGALLCALVLGVPPSAGAFVGALLAMSSTTIVVKCLESTRSTATLFGQITVGTLITQDMLVGFLFALAPLFKPTPHEQTPSDAAEQKGIAVVLVLAVLLKLAATLLVGWLVARTLLRAGMRMLRRHGTRELNQLMLCAWCFACAWWSGHVGLSSELGAFLAGAMVSISGAGGPAERGGGTAVVTGAGGGHGSKHDSKHDHHSGGGMNGGTPGSVSHGGLGGHSGAGGHHQLAPEVAVARESIDSISNILLALFLSAIGLLLAPTFLWRHIHVLALGQVCLVVVKGLLVAAVVRAYGTPWRTAAAVGISMAHVGEFALVLLSMGWHLGILPAQVYELLLGVTALSLLTTPLVILLCARVLRLDVHHHHHPQHATSPLYITITKPSTPRSSSGGDNGNDDQKEDEVGRSSA